MCSNGCPDVGVAGGIDPLLLPAASQSTERDRCRDRLQGVVCAPRYCYSNRETHSVAKAGI